MASWLMKNVKDGSLMKNVKDGSRRLKDELARSMGTANEGDVDPVLEERTARFARYAERLDDVSRAMTHYRQTAQAHARASELLLQSFSSFFESQLQDASVESPQLTALAQGALRVQEVQQSLRENVLDVAHDLQQSVVTQSLQEMQQSNSGLQQQLRALKQKISDYDSAQRSAESEKRSPADHDKAQLKLQAATAALTATANEVDAEMSALESRRDTELKNELLAVVASQLFIHSRAQEHLQQLVPLLPGVAKPLVLLLAESARRRKHLQPQQAPPSDPATSDVMGVLSYAGEGACGVVVQPVHGHTELLLDIAPVHPISPAPFQAMHFAEKLAAATYARRR